MKTRVSVTEDMALCAGIDLKDMVAQYERQSYVVVTIYFHPAVGEVYEMVLVEMCG